MAREASSSAFAIARVPAIVAGPVVAAKTMVIGAIGIPALANTTIASDEPSSNASGATGQ
ncbi:hypothetical protein ES703_90013 [subsurface metagenome]